MSAKKTTTQDQQTTNTLDPWVKGLVGENYDFAKTAADQPFQSYGGQRFAAFNPDQTAAQAGYRGIYANQPGAGTLQNAIGQASLIGNYQPMTVGANPVTGTGYSASGTRSILQPHATGYSSTDIASTPGAQAGQIDLSGIPQVRGGSLTDIDMSQYMNPYLDSVVGGAQADAEHARQVAALANTADATKAGAWRGTALGVRNAISDSNNARDLNNTTSNLRYQGYQLGTQNAEQDLTRRLTGETTNASNMLNGMTTNAGNTQQVNLANAGQLFQQAVGNAGARTAASAFGANADNAAAGQASSQDLQAALADMAARNASSQYSASAANTASSTNADNALRASLANQSAGLQAQGQNISAASLLGQLSSEELAQAMSRTGLLENVGAQEQAQEQQGHDFDWNEFLRQLQYPAQQLAMRNSALGLIPATTNSTTNGTTVQTSSNPLGAIGSLIQGLGAIGLAPFTGGASLGGLAGLIH